MAHTSTYTVSGMTCEHCVAALTGGLSALDGVGKVSVQLVPGGDSTVTVLSTHPLDQRTTQDVVADLGFSLIGQPQSGQPAVGST